MYVNLEATNIYSLFRWAVRCHQISPKSNLRDQDLRTPRSDCAVLFTSFSATGLGPRTPAPDDRLADDLNYRIPYP